MMAAIEAGRRGRKVLIIDHAKKPGEKIRISGGGRCNFTNLGIAPDRFLSQNPRFALSALKRFTAADFIARVDAAGITWHEKTLGQLFCDGSATQVVKMLVDDMAAAGVVLWLDCGLGEVCKDGDLFRVETARGVVAGRAVIVATVLLKRAPFAGVRIVNTGSWPSTRFGRSTRLDCITKLKLAAFVSTLPSPSVQLRNV